MSARSKKTKPLKAVVPAKAGTPFAFLAALLLPAAVLATPYADPKLVEAWSRMDEFHAARGIRKAASPLELKRTATPPQLEALLDDFLDAHRNTGLLVLRGDTVLAERYQYGRTAGHRFASASVAKTVLGMLVGIAVHEKKLSLEDRAHQYVPALKGHPYGDTSIRDLLTMSSGIRFTENYSGRDDSSKLVANTLRQQTQGGADTVLEFKQREAPAGTRFHYASADSQVLGLVLTAAVREPLSTYLSEKIWQPMGAEANATWLLDKGGYETGYCCINATLRDYARFGMLLANYGALDGKQIIPADWVEAATTPSAPYLKVGVATPNNVYGYQTWVLGNPNRRPRAGGDPVRFAALGIHGQAIFIDPVSKLVVVHTAAWSDPTDRSERGAQFKLLEAIYAKLESQ
jgi:CubicO group peptidase (beta-lactamase class C family)